MLKYKTVFLKCYILVADGLAARQKRHLLAILGRNTSKMGADFCEETFAINPAGAGDGADADAGDGAGRSRFGFHYRG